MIQRNNSSTFLVVPAILPLNCLKIQDQLSDSDGTLEQLLLAGANVVRLNFSHGSAQDHIRRAQTVRDIAARHHLQVAIMGDLQGPKIRISTFKDGAVTLAIGSKFILDAEMPVRAGTSEAMGIDYKALPTDVGPNDILLLDDGRVQLTVERVEGSRIHTTVLVGGKLSNNKGLNKLGGGLSAEALTDKDKADLHTAASIGVDYLAVSFPRCGDDLRYTRKLAEEAGCYARIVAKVERAEAVATEEAMDEIIQASDVLMVARGDLGVEIGDSALVGVQKTLIRHANRYNRAVITATQMMESMINSPMPKLEPHTVLMRLGVQGFTGKFRSIVHPYDLRYPPLQPKPFKYTHHAPACEGDIALEGRAGPVP